MKVTEKILVVLCIIGAFLKINSVEGGLILSVVFFCLLAFLYLFFGFLFFNEIPLKSVFRKSAYGNTNWKKIIWSIFVGYSISTTIIGILFVLANWNGAGIMFISGFSVALFVFLISFILYLISRSKFQLRILFRIGILLLLYVFIFVYTVILSY